MLINEIIVLKMFGENLRKARLSYGITQEEMALEIGFDRTYISLLERGKRNPSLITICKIASFLKIDFTVLLNNLIFNQKELEMYKNSKLG
jgi:transcriptional regulator with XRE-family HTH domain